MTESLKLNHPWLVAVWPGMGNVALSAGYYLLAKLATAALDLGYFGASTGALATPLLRRFTVLVARPARYLHRTAIRKVVSLFQSS